MLTYGVVDTETTGMDHEADRLVEIACVREDGITLHENLMRKGVRNGVR